MGWVKARLDEYRAYSKLLPAFWDQMRDSMGAAVAEFNNCAKIIFDDQVTMNDCQAKGRFCARLTRHSISIEVFLCEEKRLLQTYQHGKDTRTVCAYRFTPESGMEWYVEIDGIANSVSVEAACERALSGFLFDPMPQFYKE
jgi:hypothetical protein